MSTWRGLVAVALMLAGVPAAGEASPLDLFGFGGRSPAMAGSGVATSTDFDSVYLNPAGLADAVRKRLTVGGMYGAFALEIEDRGTGTEPARGVILGGALPIPLGGALRDRVALGLGFLVPTEALNRARHPLPGEPTFALLDTRSHVVALQVAAGVRLGGGWRAGAGILTLAELRGGIHVSTDAAGRFTTRSQQQLVSHFTPIVGVRRVAHGGRWRFGLTVRGESRSDYDILVTNDLQDDLPLTIPTLRIAGTSQYDPFTVAAEAAWQASPAMLLVGHLSYQRWSAFPQPTLPPVEGAAAPEPTDFRDIAVPRLALEWAPSPRLAVRAGYAFHLSPAPEQRGKHSLLDNHRHVLGAGVGMAWPEAYAPLSVDLWLQGHALVPRRHSKDPDRFGPDEPMPFATVETTGRILVGGVTVGVDL